MNQQHIFIFLSLFSMLAAQAGTIFDVQQILKQPSISNTDQQLLKQPIKEKIDAYLREDVKAIETMLNQHKEKLITQSTSYISTEKLKSLQLGVERTAVGFGTSAIASIPATLGFLLVADCNTKLPAGCIANARNIAAIGYLGLTGAALLTVLSYRLISLVQERKNACEKLSNLIELSNYLAYEKEVEASQR